MSNIWARFDNIVTPTEVADVKTQFTPLEEGVYTMRLEEIAPSESRNGLPMLKGKFRIIENNRIAFYNQMLQNINNPNMTAVNVAEAVNFISGLLQEDIDFVGLESFANLITEIPIGTTHTIQISYGKNDVEKKFPKLRVTKPLDLDTSTNDDIPF